jgi:hypothetical protein
MSQPEDRERQADQLDRIRKEADRLPQGTDEQPLAPDIAPDRTRRFRSVNFSRMRTEWQGEDAVKVAEIGRIADGVMATTFADAYWLMERLYRIVRTRLVTVEGEAVKDLAGRSKWKRNELGFYIEDWSRLGDAERDDFMHELTIHLFEWRQQAAVMWGSAMFAKGIWEETFAYGYTTARSGAAKLTIDDRTQAGHLASIEERYFAIFESILSKRADALIRSLERLEDMLNRAARI